MRLTSFYSGGTVCTPSRMALLTGAYPARLGWTKGVLGYKIADDRGLSQKAVTIAELFRAAGYATAISGTWGMRRSRVLADSGVEVVRTAIQAPDMNAIAERWVRSIKTECLNKIIPFGFRSLEQSVNEFVAHYNEHRPHQGIGNELIDGTSDSGTGEVIVSERLGGMLKHYHRAAARVATDKEGEAAESYVEIRARGLPALTPVSQARDPQTELREARADHWCDTVEDVIDLLKRRPARSLPPTTKCSTSV